MIIKEQKEIKFINDCNCLVDFNELSKAIIWYQDKQTAHPLLLVKRKMSL